MQFFALFCLLTSSATGRAALWQRQDTSAIASLTSQIGGLTSEVASVIASASSVAAASSSTPASSSAAFSSSASESSVAASSTESPSVTSPTASVLTTTIAGGPVPSVTSNTSMTETTSTVNTTVSQTPVPSATSNSTTQKFSTLTTTIAVTPTPSATSNSTTTATASTVNTTVPVIPLPSVTSNSTTSAAFSTLTTTITTTVAETAQPSINFSATSIISPTPVATPSAVLHPTGGIGYDTTPGYKPTSDYDFQSINLALHQALMEQALFQYGNTTFSSNNLSAAGLNAEDQKLFPYLAEQQIGQVDLLSNILYPNVTQACTYSFPAFADAREFVDFGAKALRFGESGMLGFLSHLDAQDSASLLQGALAVKSRQQMLFRQLEGLFPIPYDFVPAITQNMQFSLLAPYISSCPSGNPSVQWGVYPTLYIQNNPFFPDIALGANNQPAITNDPSTVTYVGRELTLGWDAPGNSTGPDGSFTTASSAGTAQYVAWISQLNTTYTELTLVNNTNSPNATSALNGTSAQPFVTVFANTSVPLLNGTVFLLVTDEAVAVTPYNLSQIESHIVAGPALFTMG